MSVVGILNDEADPAVSVMKVEHAPTESYADVGGLEAQIEEIKEAVELPLTHPELYEDIGIKPPKVRAAAAGGGGGAGRVVVVVVVVVVLVLVVVLQLALGQAWACFCCA